MNVFLYENKTLLKSSIIWGIALTLCSILFIFMYPGFEKDMGAFKKMLEAYPPEVLTAFGAELSIIESFLGFYAFGMIYLIFAGAVQGMLLGIRCVAKEYNDKTVEFLFTKPVKRITLLSSKLLAALLNILVTVCIYSVLSLFCALKVLDSVDVGKFLLLSLALFLIEIIFMAMGFLIGVVMGAVKSPVMVSLGVVSCFFLLELIGNSSEEGWIEISSILNYFTPSKLIREGGAEFDKVLLWAVISAVCFLLGLLIFQKKDIHVG